MSRLKQMRLSEMIRSVLARKRSEWDFGSSMPFQPQRAKRHITGGVDHSPEPIPQRGP